MPMTLICLLRRKNRWRGPPWVEARGPRRPQRQGMNGRPGFIIRAVTQSAQGPDFNDRDPSFFHFPQCDV